LVKRRAVLTKTSIVAVTGLAGKAFASWQAAEGSMWLRDFLPQDVENIRVSIFGYSSELFESNSNAGLLDYTKIFLQTLQNSRNRKTGRVSCSLSDMLLVSRADP